MNHLGGRRRSIIAQRTAPQGAVLVSAEVKHEEVKEETRQEGPVLKGRKMCPHCGKVPAYHFHVKKCGGK